MEGQEHLITLPLLQGDPPVGGTDSGRYSTMDMYSVWLKVGGGLPPMAVGQPQMYWLTLPHRGQAPSHLFECVST